MSQEQVEIEPKSKKTSTDKNAPKKKPSLEPQKKSPLIAIVAIVVVLALIGTAFLVMMQGGTAQNAGLKVVLSPTSIDMANGSQIRIFAYVYFLNNTNLEVTDPTAKNISNSVSTAVSVTWQQGEDELGEIIAGRLGTARYWQLNSKAEGESDLNWSFKYRDSNSHLDFWLNKTIPVTITVAELDYISLSPPSSMMLKDSSQMFTAESYLTNGELVNATYTWAMDNSSVGTISDTDGPSTNLTAGSVNATGNLICNGTYAGKTVSSVAPIQVITVLPESETATRIYDIFNVPLSQTWVDRYQEEVLSWNYPTSYKWLGAPAGNNWLYSNYRMNVTAKNISAANTQANPVYVPITNPDPNVRGGNIEINLTSKYLSRNETIARNYGGQINIWYDSWYFATNGTITMDKVAAKMVLNMTDSDFRNFNSWKTQKFNSFVSYYSSWLLYEMNTRLAIKYAYEWEGSTVFEAYDIMKVGDKVVFVIKDYLSWGFESLLGKWMRDTFMSFEGWPDDMTFHAKIGPLWSSFDFDACMEYSLVAKKSTRGDTPVWVFENTHADAAPGTSSKLYNGKYVNYTSDMEPYGTKTYWNFLVSNAMYGNLSPYDYTPWAWNLGPKDTWSLKYPSGSGIVGYKQVGANITGHVDPLWIEPIPGEVPGNMVISNHYINMTGPFDALDWSKNSNGAREEKENWSRIGLLPRGVPYVELAVNSATQLPPVASLSVPPLVGVNGTITLVSGSYDLDGTIVKYEWGFDDNQSAPGHVNTTTPYTTHAWMKWEGYHKVTLKVTDDDGATATDTTWVHAVYNMPPSAAYSISKSVIKKLEGVSLDASASTDADGTIVSYFWDFGDGTNYTSTSPLASHNYDETGVYKLDMTVTDNRGGKTNVTRYVAVQPNLVAKFVMPDRAAVNEVVTLSAVRSFSFNNSRTIVNYTWDFGDGAKGSGINVTHSWASPGKYNVTLFINDTIGDKSWNWTGRINIGIDTIAGLSIGLSRHSLFPDETATLTITAVNGAGQKVSSTDDIDVAVNGTGTWTGLPVTSLSLVGGVASFGISCDDIGSYNITANINGDPSINGSTFITIAGTTIEIKVYDFMQDTLGQDLTNLSNNYWSRRLVWGDLAYRFVAPTYHTYFNGADQLASNIDTTYRVNVSARNVTNINMANPTFFPRLNSGTGGSVSWTWNYNYLDVNDFWWWNYGTSPDAPKNPYTWSTNDQMLTGDPQFFLYNQGTSGYDGWETFMTINITMDRDAAYQMIGLPKAEASPIHWWDRWNGGHGNNDTVQTAWDAFMVNEGGSGTKAGRLDIRSCDDGYPWKQGFWGWYQWLTVNGDGTVTMHIWRVGYGEDTLLCRWLYWGGVTNGWNYPNGTPKGIIPFEPYYDDFRMVGEMNSSAANITLDAGVIYGFRAQKSKDPSCPAETAVWRWEQVRIDYLGSSIGAWNRSEMDPWATNGMTFQVWDPAGTGWGINVPADQTPNIIYLDVGESLIMEKPKDLVSGLMQYSLLGDRTQTADRAKAGMWDWMNLIEKWGNASIHPLGCYPGTSVLDKGTGDLTIVGPFWPIVDYYPSKPWLHMEQAPLIEYWIE